MLEENSSVLCFFVRILIIIYILWYSYCNSGLVLRNGIKYSMKIIYNNLQNNSQIFCKLFGYIKHMDNI